MQQPGYNQLVDGFRAITGGIDSGLNPSLLGRESLAFGVNTTTRGGYVANRPGWKKLDIVFPNTATEVSFRDDLFQGGIYYDPSNGGPYLASSHGGKIMLIDLNDMHLLEITDAASRRMPNIPQVWMAQAEDWLLASDGLSAVLQFNGATVTLANPALKQTPAGQAMCYSMGRFWVARGRYYIGSDLMPGTSDAPTFTENDVINLGGSFAVPQQGGDIVGFHTVANLDTSLGQGGLAVFTRNTVHILNVPFDRTLWKNLTNVPLQSVALLKYGATSQNSICAVNSDLFYRSKDGLRSLQIARRDFGNWGNLPISTELQLVISLDDRFLLDRASATLFDNRYLFTVRPTWVPDHGVCHQGLGVIDFAFISGLTKRTSPVYDGIWTGARILQVVSGEVDGVDHCWAYVLNPVNQVELWELTTSDLFDGDEIHDRIDQAFETGCMDFQTPYELKTLQTADIWYDSLAGTIECTLKYRPNQYPGWFTWHTWTETADYGVPLPLLGPMPLPEYRTRVSMPLPPDADVVDDNRKANSGYDFQFRLEVRGPARVKRFMVKARREIEPEFGTIK